MVQYIITICIIYITDPELVQMQFPNKSVKTHVHCTRSYPSSDPDL